MSTSQDLYNQIQGMGDMPNYRQQIAAAYDAPVMRPIVNERAGLESQVLPALFQPFTQMGTGASDMSPAAKLAAIGNSLGRIGGRIQANQGIQDFYGNQIGQLAGLQSQNWMTHLGTLKDMYTAQVQKEAQQSQQAAQMAALQFQKNQWKYQTGIDPDTGTYHPEWVNAYNQSLTSGMPVSSGAAQPSGGSSPLVNQYAATGNTNSSGSYQPAPGSLQSIGSGLNQIGRASAFNSGGLHNISPLQQFFPNTINGLTYGSQAFNNPSANYFNTPGMSSPLGAATPTTGASLLQNLYNTNSGLSFK